MSPGSRLRELGVQEDSVFVLSISFLWFMRRLGVPGGTMSRRLISFLMLSGGVKLQRSLMLIDYSVVMKVLLSLVIIS